MLDVGRFEIAACPQERRENGHKVRFLMCLGFADRHLMNLSAEMFSQVTMLVKAAVSGVYPLASRDSVDGLMSSSPASCLQDSCFAVRAASSAACRLATSTDV